MEVKQNQGISIITSDKTNNEALNKAKWLSQEEKDIVMRVNDEVENIMKPYRNSACYFDEYTLDMNTHWDNCDERYIMTSTNQETSEGYSDVKPPTVYKNVEAICAEIQDGELRIRFRPQGGPKDADRAYVYEQILEYKNKVNELDIQDSYLMFNTALKGNSYVYCPWTTVINQGKFEKEVSSLTKEEKNLMTNMNQLTYQTKKYKTYDDFDSIFVPNGEMFVEPGGTRFYGRHNRINKKCWERWISWDEFKYMFSFDPFARNVDLVTPVGTEGMEYSDYFKKPEKIFFDKKVRLRIYEDPFADEIIVIANDILIKNMPTPDKFKGKSLFVDFHYLDLPEKHYTPGVAAVLAGLQDEESTLKNMIYDYLHMEINPPTYVDSLMAEELLSAKARQRPGDIISLTGLAQNPNGIQPHRTNGSGVNAALNMLPSISNDQTQTIGLDPRKFGTIQRSGNATEVQSNDAASLKVLMKYIRGYSRSKAQVADLQYRWIRTRYMDPLVDSEGKVIFDDEEAKKKAKLPTIYLENIEITPSKDKNVLYKKIDRVGWYPLDLKKEYLEFEADPYIYVDEDDIKRLNKPLEIQAIQNTLAQVSIYSGIPGQPAQYGGPAILDISKILKSYIKVQHQPLEWLIQQSGSVEDAISSANEHMITIFQKNQPLIGEVGVAKEHIEYEEGCLRNLQSAIVLLQKVVQQEIQNPQVQFDPQTGQALPHQPSQNEKNLMNMMDKMGYLEMHLFGHRGPAGTPQLPLSQVDQAVAAVMAPPPPPGQVPPQGGPQGPNQPAPGPNSAPNGGGRGQVPPPTPMPGNVG